MTTAERRQKILTILCEKRKIKMTQLVEQFDVCRTTLVNDVFVLSLSYPIYTTKGNGGGVFVVDGFELSPKRLNDKETSLLVKLLSQLSGEDKATMTEIIKKIGGKNEARRI